MIVKINDIEFLVLSSLEGETEKIYKLLSKEGKTYIYSQYYRCDIVCDEDGFYNEPVYTKVGEILKEDNDTSVLLESRHFKELIKFLKG